MGFDDGTCEQAANGVHVLVLAELVAEDSGRLGKVHRCALCGAEAYEASEDPATRPPL